MFTLKLYFKIVFNAQLPLDMSTLLFLSAPLPHFRHKGRLYLHLRLAKRPWWLKFRNQKYICLYQTLILDISFAQE